MDWHGQTRTDKDRQGQTRTDTDRHEHKLRMIEKIIEKYAYNSAFGISCGLTRTNTDLHLSRLKEI